MESKLKPQKQNRNQIDRQRHRLITNNESQFSKKQKRGYPTQQTHVEKN